jgi:hypothetical protein
LLNKRKETSKRYSRVGADHESFDLEEQFEIS